MEWTDLAKDGVQWSRLTDNMAKNVGQRSAVLTEGEWRYTCLVRDAACNDT